MVEQGSDVSVTCSKSALSHVQQLINSTKQQLETLPLLLDSTKDLQKAKGGEIFKCVWTKEEGNVDNLYLLFACTEPE